MDEFQGAEEKAFVVDEVNNVVKEVKPPSAFNN